LAYVSWRQQVIRRMWKLVRYLCLQLKFLSKCYDNSCVQIHCLKQARTFSRVGTERHAMRNRKDTRWTETLLAFSAYFLSRMSKFPSARNVREFGIRRVFHPEGSIPINYRVNFFLELTIIHDRVCLNGTT